VVCWHTNPSTAACATTACCQAAGKQESAKGNTGSTGSAGSGHKASSVPSFFRLVPLLEEKCAHGCDPYAAGVILAEVKIVREALMLRTVPLLVPVPPPEKETELI